MILSLYHVQHTVQLDVTIHNAKGGLLLIKVELFCKYTDFAMELIIGI